MQNTPALYKSELKKTCRRPSYVQVYIGIVNYQAQRSYALTSQSLLDNHGDLNNPIGELIPLATWEYNRVAVDGSQYFMAYDYRMMRYGFISKALSDNSGNFAEADKPTITYDFSTAQDIYGVTLYMDDTYGTVATELTVDGYLDNVITESQSFTNTNNEPTWILTLSFSSIDKLVITVNKLSKPKQHLHIHKTLMGIGLSFNNYDITNTDLSVTTDPLSGAIPSYSFKLTLNNVFNRFNFEDPDNFIWFVQNRQKLNVSYGQEIENGEIVWLKGGTYIVNEPPIVNETTAEINAGSVFEFLDFDFDGTALPAAPQDLYSLIENVFRNANKWYMPPGIKLTYVLDNGMKSIFTSAPLPKAEVKQVLQYIANAAMCSIYIDRDSNIIFKSAYIPSVTLETTQGIYYSSNVGILEGQVSSSNYARWSDKFITVAGLDYFAPTVGDTDSYLKTGYVSSNISDTTGYLAPIPTLTITYTAATNVSNLTIVSDVAIIKQMSIFGYRGDTIVFEDSVTATDRTLVYPDIILNVDKLVINVIQIDLPNAPLIIKRIDSTERTNYLLNRVATAGEPETTILNPLRAVNVQVYKYVKQTTLETLDTVTVYCAPQSNTLARIEFTEPVAVTEITVSEGRLATSGSTAYVTEASISNFGDTGFNSTVTVKGYKINVTQETYVHTIQSNGYVETVDNPLITTKEHAEKIAKWIESYSAYPKQYTVPYRGDPSIDAMDFIRYETKSHTTPLTLVTEYNLSVGQGMSGSLVLKEVEE